MALIEDFHGSHAIEKPLELSMEYDSTVPLNELSQTKGGIIDKNDNQGDGSLTDTSGDESDDVIIERGTWGHKVDFLLSLLGYAVGLANIWRFPYLCYRNGGGAFLIPYWIFICICGIPMFIMEVALGQFTSRSNISMWSLCPIFKGVGYATIVITLIYATYYNVIMAYVMFFFIQSFTSDQLPWASCNNWWNSDDCLDFNNQTMMNMHNAFMEFKKNGRGTNSSFENTAPYFDLFENRTLKSPSDEYFHNRVLQISSGLDEPGNMRWELVVALIPVWIITGLCLVKGVKSVGKVVYFTATFPYMILFILFCKGITLPGAAKGIAFYILPDLDRKSVV